MDSLREKNPARRVLGGLFSFINERTFVRSIYADNMVETFLISAIAAVLLIRMYLGITGYPQLAAGGLHVAHVVWGGLLMLVSVVVLLSFASRPAREIASFLGGVGFGTFVDEVGKFLTQDNNYFFQPAIAIIYVIFALVYVAGKALTRERSLSQRECLSHVVEILNHGIHEGLYPQDRDRAFALLARCDPDDQTVRNLGATLAQMDVAAATEPGILSKLRRLPYRSYQRAVRQPWFLAAVVGLFLLQSVTTLVENVALVQWSLGLAFWFIGGGLAMWSLVFFRRGQISPFAIVVAALLVMLSLLTTRAVLMNLRETPWSFVTMGSIIFPAVSSALVLVGIGLLPHSRLAAFQMFQRAILITILLTQVYAFYEDQLIALSGLFINIVILLALRYMINQEQARSVESVRMAAVAPVRR